MSYCWKCEQKKGFIQSLIEEAENEAKRRAEAEGVTMVIVKESGSVYRVMPLSEIGGQTAYKYITA